MAPLVYSERVEKLIEFDSDSFARLQGRDLSDGPAKALALTTRKELPYESARKERRWSLDSSSCRTAGRLVT